MEERPSYALIKATQIYQNWQKTRNCSECEKLFEIREVAKKLPRNLWKTLEVLSEIKTFYCLLKSGAT